MCPWFRIQIIRSNPSLQVINNNLNPTWKLFEIPLATLCNCDKQRNVKVECFDWDSDGSHDLIGSCEFNVEQLLSKKNFPVDLINPKKKAKKKGYKNSGTLGVERCELVQNPSFLDYITGGVELCFHVAIDFTGGSRLEEKIRLAEISGIWLWLKLSWTFFQNTTLLHPQ